jgi:hypothetical protein
MLADQGEFRVLRSKPRTQDSFAVICGGFAAICVPKKYVRVTPLRQSRAALPAQIEGRGILLPALGASDRWAARHRTHVLVDERPRPLGVGGIVHPHLRPRGIDGKLAGQARGMRVENTRADAPVGEQVYEEVSLGKVAGGVDALQKRIDNTPVMPSSSTPERPDTFV